MVKVIALRPHRNIHGNHEKDDEYDHDRPAADVKFGYVKLVSSRRKPSAVSEGPQS